MAAAGELSEKITLRSLANLSTIYVLLCLDEDTVSSDEEFRRYIQSCDRYWESIDQLSESLLNAEFQLLNSLGPPLTEIINDAVQQHHQLVADAFVAAFQDVVSRAGNQRSAWLDFAVFAGSMSIFLRHFGMDYVSTKRLPIFELCDEFTNIVNANTLHFQPTEHIIAVEKLQCEAKWHQYVAEGIRRFSLAMEQAK